MSALRCEAGKSSGLRYVTTEMITSRNGRGRQLRRPLRKPNQNKVPTLAARTTIVFSATDALCSKGLTTETAVLVAPPLSSQLAETAQPLDL